VEASVLGARALEGSVLPMAPGVLLPSSTTVLADENLGCTVKDSVLPSAPGVLLPCSTTMLADETRLLVDAT